MGLNRLNVYAGLVGMFFIRDHQEDALNLPAGKYEVPLILYDRNLTTDGQLFYPVSADPEHPWVSEFAGDAILVNGKIRPFHEVEPRLYRIRLVNAANSRFFRLSVHVLDPAASNPSDRTRAVPFHQIGSDQGLLAAPVELNVVTYAPGERADLLIDFSQFAGQNVHLRNNAFDILQFRVAQHAEKPAPATVLPKSLRTITHYPVSSAITTRTITLNEYQDDHGNSMVMLLNRKQWHEPVTERPRLNTTEIWEFVNLTEDVHPMHLHLVRFQVLDRRTFDDFEYLMYKKLRYTGPAMPPEPNETGWKDVVQCSAAVITRVLVRFEGYVGSYLYHCHILEHEANDMMRPFEVIA
jgi:spore coat protein A